MAGGEDGGQVRRPEPPRLPAAAGRRGPPVAGEDLGGAFPGRARLMGEAGPEAGRGHRRRRRLPGLGPGRGVRTDLRTGSGADRLRADGGRLSWPVRAAVDGPGLS